LRPWLYGIPARIPQLGLGRTIYTTDYPLALPDRVLVALGFTMLRRLDEFTAVRRANAESLLEKLRGLGFQAITPHGDASPAYLRLPVLLPGRREQEAAVAALKAAGIGATASYPESIVDVPELQGSIAGPLPSAAAGGRQVARRIVTLPTHPLVTAADIRRIQKTLGGRASSLAAAKVYPS
jgi:perosamine synthetase